MKTFFLTAALTLLSLSGASALERKLATVPQLYTCAGNSLSRIALRPDPAACCSGMLGCPQLLANTGLIKPRRDNRT